MPRETPVFLERRYTATIVKEIAASGQAILSASGAGPLGPVKSRFTGLQFASIPSVCRLDGCLWSNSRTPSLIPRG